MNVRDFSFVSNTCECEISASEYTPEDGDVKAVLVINHGMAEHRDRYQKFIGYLTSNGYAVFMHDMANHGKSNQDKALLGYFGQKDGYKDLVADFKNLFDTARIKYPDKKIVVMGHSMGSFIVRAFTAWYPSSGFDGAIYMGTGGKNPMAGIGDKLSSVIAKCTGYTKKVKLLDTMSFGSYNDKFSKRTSYDWLTRDNDIVDKYIADEYCGFLFSAQGMNDLVKLNIVTNTDEWYDEVPKNIHIIIMSGDMDPVGEYGKGPKDIYEKLINTGHSKAEIKLYQDDRHEILNEFDREQVYSDINDFIQKVMGD